MKFVLQWELPANVSEDHLARSIKVFSGWQRSEGVDYHQLLGRVDGRGGFAVLDSSDPVAMARDAALFTAYFPGTLHPVLEIGDFARVSAEAIELRSALR